jgi:uncharacterized membrane protein YqiK
MRVYELAKKMGVSSKDLMALLEKEKIEASSHMALLSDEDVLRIEKLVNKKNKETAPQTKQKEVRSMQGEQQSRAPKKVEKKVNNAVKNKPKAVRSQERTPEKRVHTTAAVRSSYAKASNYANPPSLSHLRSESSGGQAELRRTGASTDKKANTTVASAAPPAQKPVPTQPVASAPPKKQLTTVNANLQKKRRSDLSLSSVLASADTAVSRGAA